MPQATDIIALCQNLIKIYPNDCSGFARAVAAKCGVYLFGNANEILQFISGHSRRLPNGTLAREAASRGELVIGGLTAAGHGHVVIVVKDPTGHNQYPYAFWGQYHGMTLNHKEYNAGFTRGHGHLNFAFQKAALDTLVYGSFRPSQLITPRADTGAGYLLAK